MKMAMTAVLAAGFLAGCETRHTIVFEQPKPIEVNINISGRMELVIEDARQNLQNITGEKPAQVVKPEDIGLPAGAGPQGMGAAVGGMMIAAEGDGRVVYLAAQTEASLAEGMKARHGVIRGLWNAKAVGESHTGLLEVKGNLTPEQKAQVDAENADRSALYGLEATRRGLTPAQVGQGYYLARLGYAQAGNWYEKFDKAGGKWEWKEWGK